MSQRLKNITAIYGSGFLQGVALVLYPAAGTIFTNADFHGLTSSEYGILFIPQIIFAILSSLSAPELAKWVGMKKVLAWGLMANVLAMLFFAGSAYCMGVSTLPFWLLLLGTSMLGTGFGFTITALNPFAYNLFPGKEASAVTGMHIFLGLGTASAPLILQAFKGMGAWGAAGLAVAIALSVMLFFQMSLALTLAKKQEKASGGSKRKTPGRVWLYALVIFFYGSCEATFGNWGAIYLEKQAGLSIATAALGLSLFWASITLGRVLFTLLALRFNTKILYLVMPFAVALVFFMMPSLNGQAPHLGAMAVGGLGLSFFFPNTISIATDEFPYMATIVSGAMVAAIQIGTGVSANMVGYLNETVSLSTIFRFSALYALAAGLLSLFLHASRQKKSFFLTK
jgi:fucose permease